MGPGKKKNKLPAECNGSITLNSKWYGNCKKCGHCRLYFLHQFCPHMVTGYRSFWGAYRFTWFGALFNTTGASLAKVVYAYFDRISYEQIKTVTACKCLISPEYVTTLFESAKFHMKFSFWKFQFHMKFPEWKCPISYEFPWLEVPNFIWTFEFPWLEIPCLEVPDFIWTFEFPWLEALNFIWISMFGSAKFHMKFLAWTCKVSFQTAKFHKNFSVWKCQISYEFTCLEVRNFIWTFEIPWLEGLNFIPFLERVLSSIWTYEFPCYEFPRLEVHLFYLHSLFGSARFHMNIWISLIGSAKFQLNFHVWKCQISYEIPCLDVQSFISNCQIS